MSELNLNAELIRSCNNASQFDAGNGIVAAAEQTLAEFDEKFGSLKGLNNRQTAYIANRRMKYIDFVNEVFNEQLSRRSSFVPVNVAGPSKYPSEKMNKRADKMMERKFEQYSKLEAFIENTFKGIENLKTLDQVLEDIRRGKSVEIRSDDPDALIKLQTKLEVKQGLQNHMKDVNAYYRKHKSLDGYDELPEEFRHELLLSMAASIYPNIVYAPFELQNNNAEIRRIKERITHLTKHREEQRLQGYNFDGGSVVANYDIDRLQILFDSKPDEDIRTELKSCGFRWSPREGAWQRQLTGNALYAAKRLFKEGAVDE